MTKQDNNEIKSRSYESSNPDYKDKDYDQKTTTNYQDNYPKSFSTKDLDESARSVDQVFDESKKKLWEKDRRSKKPNSSLRPGKYWYSGTDSSGGQRDI